MKSLSDTGRSAWTLPPSAVFAGIATGLVVMAVLLLELPPSSYSFYPPCPIRSLLHIQCPGCGTTRAMAALLHGDLAEALRLNALSVCAVPLSALYAGYCWVRGSVLRLPVRAVSPVVIYAALAGTAVFTLVRNF